MTDLEIHSDEKKCYQGDLITAISNDKLVLRLDRMACAYMHMHISLFSDIFFMTYICSSELCGHQAPITINLHSGPVRSASDTAGSSAPVLHSDD